MLSLPTNYWNSRSFWLNTTAMLFKVKAYRRAARTIRTMGESFDELVRDEADLTQYPGIGKAIGKAIHEIVQTGTLRQVEALRAESSPARVAISAYPRLDREARAAHLSKSSKFRASMN